MSSIVLMPVLEWKALYYMAQPRNNVIRQSASIGFSVETAV